jgi:hypothetical protein
MYGNPIIRGVSFFRRFFSNDEVGKTLEFSSTNRILPILITQEDVEDPSEGIKDELRSVAYTSDALSAMQISASFCGPMIGLGAAVQAAKNNGFENNDDFTEVVNEHYNRLSSPGGEYSDNFLAQELPNRTSEENAFPYDYLNRGWDIAGYSWRNDYTEMLDQISQFGMPFAINVRYLGTPNLKGDTWFQAYASEKVIYDAVAGNAWCILKEVLRQDYNVNNGAWWGNLERQVDPNNFVKESEYISVGMRLKTSPASSYSEDQKGAFINPMLTDSSRNLTSIRDRFDDFDPMSQVESSSDTDGKYSPLTFIPFAEYDDTWRDYDDEMVNDWQEYTKKNFISGYKYWGCTVKIRVQQEMGILSGFWGKEDEYNGRTVGSAIARSSAYKEIDVLGQKTSVKKIGHKLSNSEHNIKNIKPEIETTAVAKVYGRLEADSKTYTPNYPGIILPVFDKITLIPVSLEDAGGLDPFDVDFYRWVTEGLPILGQHTSLASAKQALRSHQHWPSFAKYMGVIEKLNDPTWRNQGILWLDTIIDPVTGKTNEDNCDWGNGGGGGGGGPPKLH